MKEKSTVLQRRRQLLPPSIYIVTTQELWPTKIGVANHPNNRLQSLQCGCWIELHLYKVMKTAAAFELENEIKYFMRDSQLKGEWFDATAPDLAKLLETIVHEYRKAKTTITRNRRIAWHIPEESLNDLLE